MRKEEEEEEEETRDVEGVGSCASSNWNGSRVGENTRVMNGAITGYAY